MVSGTPLDWEEGMVMMVAMCFRGKSILPIREVTRHHGNWTQHGPLPPTAMGFYGSSVRETKQMMIIKQQAEQQ